MTDLKLNVMTDRMDRAVTDADTTILRMPKGFMLDIGDGEGPALLAVQFMKFLRSVAEKQAADVGEELHHAEFTVTDSPATVQALGSLHDCPECHAGVRRALRDMREHPGTEMVVGQLFWAGP